MAKKKPKTRKKSIVPEKYLGDRAELAVRKKWIDSGLETAINVFGRLPQAPPQEKRVIGRMLRAMRHDLMASFKDLRWNMPLTISEIRFLDRAIKILKENYTREGLEEILSLTCTLSGEPHPIHQGKKATARKRRKAVEWPRRRLNRPRGSRENR